MSILHSSNALIADSKTSTFKPQEDKTNKGKTSKGKGKGKTKIDINKLKKLAIAEWNNPSPKAHITPRYLPKKINGAK